MKTRITALLGILFLASTTFAGNTPSNNDLKDQGVPKIDIALVNAPANVSTASYNEAAKNAFVKNGASEKMMAKPLIATANFGGNGNVINEVILKVSDSEVGAFESIYKLPATMKIDHAHVWMDGSAQQLATDYATRLAKRNNTNGATRNGAGGSPKK